MKIAVLLKTVIMRIDITFTLIKSSGKWIFDTILVVRQNYCKKKKKRQNARNDKNMTY